MKLAKIVVLAIPLLGSLALLHAADPIAAAGQVAIGLTGGSTWNADFTAGTCWGFLPIVGGIGINNNNTVSQALFTDPNKPSMQTARLVWVSDFHTVPMPTAAISTQAGDASYKFTIVLVPTGTAAIYYSDTPASRDLTDMADVSRRTTWGDVVATLTRHATFLHTADNFQSDNMVFWAELLSSKSFQLNGVPFDFKDLIPNGMTCFENGRNSSMSEATTCVAAGQPAIGRRR